MYVCCGWTSPLFLEKLNRMIGFPCKSRVHVAFKLPIPTTLPNPPDWTVNQVDKFLKVSPVGEMLDNEG